MGCSGSAQVGVAGSPRQSFDQKYTLCDSIGEGSYGSVQLALTTKSQEPRAVKVLHLSRKSSGDSEKLSRAAIHELKIWKQVGQHDHVIELLDHHVGRSFYCFVMERCHASLMDRMKDVVRMPDTEIVRLLQEMLYGLSHLHGRRICHRDVKPNNYLLCSESDGHVGSVKLCDFGLAQTLPKRGGLLKGCYGTPPYMSPEMVAETGHGLNTDVWSYGATVHTLLFREFPFAPVENTSKAMKTAILQGVPRGKRDVDSAEAAFCRSLMTRDAQERPDVAAALQLPFLQLRPQQLALEDKPGDQQLALEDKSGDPTPRNHEQRLDEGLPLAPSGDCSTQSGDLCRRQSSTSVGSCCNSRQNDR